MKKVKMLRDCRFNPTGKVGDFIEAKKGDVVEVNPALIEDMVIAKACGLYQTKKKAK